MRVNISIWRRKVHFNYILMKGRKREKGQQLRRKFSVVQGYIFLPIRGQMGREKNSAFGKEGKKIKDEKGRKKKKREGKKKRREK